MAQRGGRKQKLLSVLVLFLVLAVFAGYAAAKYFFDPYLLREEGKESNSVAEAEQPQPLQPGVESQDSGDQLVESGVSPAGESGGAPAAEDKEPPAVENTVPGETADDPPKEESAPPKGESAGETAAQTASSEGALASMYCVQFGSFLEEAGAKDTLDSLQAKGIDAYIVERAGTYKVLGAPFGSKEEARQARDSLLAVAGQDLFVTTMEVKIQ